MKKIALLCDYGLDDAAATLYLIKHAASFAQIDILPIGGNMPLAVSMNNARRLIAHLEDLPCNVRLVDTSSVTQFEECLPEIHGADGIGDILPPEVPENIQAMDYSQWLTQLDDSYTLVSLGPCTVTLDILKNHGPLPLLIMGGNIAEPPNYKGYEFNHGMDTEAFAKCVKYAHAAATLDTCHHPLCDFNHIPIDTGDLFGKMAARAVVLSNERNEPACYIYDLIAVGYLLHPEKFSTETAVDQDGNVLTMLRYIDPAPFL